MKTTNVKKSSGFHNTKTETSCLSAPDREPSFYDGEKQSNSLIVCSNRSITTSNFYSKIPEFKG